MAETPNISQPIIDTLYGEALLLADEVRRVFDLSPVRDTGAAAEAVRMAMSVEGLRATTRVMHVLAWLLNHRAYFKGEMSELQLRRHSRLPPDRPSEAANLHFLAQPVRELIHSTEQMHARIARLDSAWREDFRMEPPAVLRLRARIGQSFR